MLLNRKSIQPLNQRGEALEPVIGSSGKVNVADLHFEPIIAGVNIVILLDGSCVQIGC